MVESTSRVFFENLNYATFEVISVALLNIQDFWDMTPCPWANNFQRFEGLSNKNGLIDPDSQRHNFISQRA
jgi:hypothetical protein